MILVNGKVSSRIEIADRGLQYGDGLFETIAIRDERAILYSSHLKRLEDGCRRLSIPLIARRILDKEIFKLCRGVSRGVLKVIVTRGSGGRGYQPPSQPQPTRILSVHPWPNYPSLFIEYGITLRVCHTSLGYNPCLAGIKHLNRLEQVLARSEWENPMIPEGLMLDSQEHVIEGTMSNLFIVQNGRLETPDLSGCGVAGVMRELILEQAFNSRLKTIVRPLMLADLRNAEELFICNSLIGVWPVRCLGESQYPLGPVTRYLQHLVRTWLIHSD